MGNKIIKTPMPPNNNALQTGQIKRSLKMIHPPMLVKRALVKDNPDERERGKYNRASNQKKFPAAAKTPLRACHLRIREVMVAFNFLPNKQDKRINPKKALKNNSCQTGKEVDKEWVNAFEKEPTSAAHMIKKAP